MAQILQKPTSLLAAGRTDSGVHAVGQVVAFDADWNWPIDDLHRALNAVLPDDVAILELGLASPGFHPRYDALSRTYRYTIWNRRLRSPLSRHFALWVRHRLDLSTMDEAAQVLVGSHDFGTFGTAPRPTPKGRAQAAASSTVRHVMHAAWARVSEQACFPLGQHAISPQAPPPDENAPASDRAQPAQTGEAWQGVAEFTIEANAFLYRMVRSIVGTLIQVGRGDLSVSQFVSALDAKDRSRAGPTAPPHGLCLVRVCYPNN